MKAAYSNVEQWPAQPTDCAALIRMIRRGFRLFPVVARGKRPLIPGWPRRATNDEELINSWAERFPGCNWAIATGEASGIFVLDVDGESGRESIVELTNRHGAEWIETLGVKTARGRHYYFRWPAGTDAIRNSASKLAAGLDVRGEGGYVLVPPSVHPSGHVYHWFGSGEDKPIAAAATWLIQLLATTVRVASSRSLTNRATAILPGQRNATLTSLAGVMRHHDLTPQGIEMALLAENAERCMPPLQEREVRNIARSISRYPPAVTAIADAEYSDDALTLRFTDQHAGDLRYTAGWSRWSIWCGTQWKLDTTLHVFEMARKICRVAGAGAPDPKVARRVASAATIAAVERLARSDDRHAARVDSWDGDDWLLNTPTGAVDLHTGSLRGHRRQDYCTNSTATGPSGECPLWLAFLERITAGDVALQVFLKRMVGYCLTGITSEQCFFFLYGTGANGKSVFLSTVTGLLADYSRAAPMQTFTASYCDQHPTDLAGLQGARLVSAVETEEGRVWAEGRIKTLTGGDRISARFMRGDFFEFTPKFKLVIVGNHKPSLSSVNEAIRRRVRLVPFTVTIPEEERDRELLTKLKAEWPGILKWAIEGCLDWQVKGLEVPATVREATASYLQAEDVFGRWLEERCETSKKHESPSAALFKDWKEWCELSDEHVGSQKRFSQMLDGHGFQRVRNGTDRIRGFQGIALRSALGKEE